MLKQYLQSLFVGQTMKKSRIEQVDEEVLKAGGKENISSRKVNHSSVPWDQAQRKFSTKQNQFKYAQISSQNTFLQPLLDANQKLPSCDFSQFYRNKELVRALRQIRENKQLLHGGDYYQINKFLDLVSSRIQSLPYHEVVHKELLSQARKLSKITNRTFKKLQQTYNQPNEIYVKIVQQLQTRARSSLKHYIENKQTKEVLALSEYVSKYPEFFRTSKWKQIIEVVKQQIQKTYVQEIAYGSSQNRQIARIRLKMDYSKKIYKQRTVAASCLGCAPYLIYNSNIYDQDVNQTKIAIVGKVLDLIPPSEKESSKKQAIELSLKTQACGLLNNGGGALFFDCEQIYLNVMPCGQLLTKHEAKLIQQQICKILLQSVYPTIKNKQIFVLSFLPLMKDPFSKQKEEDYRWQDQFYKEMESLLIDGVFVARIVVRPPQKCQFCFQHEAKFYKAIRFKSLLKDQSSISKYQIGEEEVMRYKSNFEAQGDWIEEGNNQNYSQFDHFECKDPIYGLGVPQNMPQEKKTVTKQQQRPEKQFEFATAIVVKPEYFEELRQRLSRHSFPHFLELPFPDSKIKGAIATAIVYHNAPHSEVTALLKGLEFGGRNAVTVAISQYVKLVSRLNANRLPAQLLRNLQLWVDSELKGESQCSLTLWECKNEFQETEYYLKASGPAAKKCTLFLYLLTNHFNERSQIRDPKNPENLRQCT